jgi:hypothetical protein
MSHANRRDRGRKKRDSVFAGVVAAFASAVERLRGRPGSEVEFTEVTHLWDDDDGGLAESRVPRRPAPLSGSGSAALVEPDHVTFTDAG